MPDTDAYLFLGVAITFTILVGYSASLLLRFRQSNKMFDTLEKIKREG